MYKYIGTHTINFASTQFYQRALPLKDPKRKKIIKKSENHLAEKK